MRKLRSDALWHKLSPEQQKKIEDWFFVENLSYRAVRDRMGTELGVTCAVSTIGPMYHHCRQLRSQQRHATLDKLTEILTDRRSDLRRIPTDSLAAISACLIHRAMARDDDPKTLISLANVMMQANLGDIRNGRKELAEEKLAFRQLKHAVSNGVAQVSKPAVSPTTKSADRSNAGKTGDLEARATLPSATSFQSIGTAENNQAQCSENISPRPGLSGLFRDKK